MISRSGHFSEKISRSTWRWALRGDQRQDCKMETAIVGSNQMFNLNEIQGDTVRFQYTVYSIYPSGARKPVILTRRFQAWIRQIHVPFGWWNRPTWPGWGRAITSKCFTTPKKTIVSDDLRKWFPIEPKGLFLASLEVLCPVEVLAPRYSSKSCDMLCFEKVSVVMLTTTKSKWKNAIPKYWISWKKIKRFWLPYDIGGAILHRRGWCIFLLNEDLKNPKILRITGRSWIGNKNIHTPWKINMEPEVMMGLVQMIFLLKLGDF